MPEHLNPAWTQDEPTEAGAYWMWDGSDDSSPAHVEVFWSGTDNRCFVPRGQYGWTRHQDMDELKGYWWHKLVCPPLPVVDSQTANVKKTVKDLFEYLEKYEPFADPVERYRNARNLVNTPDMLRERMKVVAQLLPCKRSDEAVMEWGALLFDALVQHLLLDRFIILSGRDPATEHYYRTLLHDSPLRQEKPTEKTLEPYQFMSRLRTIIDSAVSDSVSRQAMFELLSAFLPEAIIRVSKFDGKGPFTRAGMASCKEDFMPGAKTYGPYTCEEIYEAGQLCGILQADLAKHATREA